jgi:hypothetical protein
MSPITLAKIVAVVALLSILGFITAHIYDAGKTAEHLLCEKKDNDALRAANQAIVDLNTKYRQLEQDKATALSVVSDVYEGKLNDAAKQKDKDVAAARASAPQYQLRYATAPGACADRSPATPFAPSPGQRDGQTTAQLPGEVAASLFAIVDDADALVDQLDACQAVVEADRK